MNFIDRQRYRDGMIDLCEAQRPTVNVVAQLPPHTRRAALEHALRRCDAHVNDHYLGGRWASPKMRAQRMFGIGQFEVRGQGGLHAHISIRPPAGVSAEQFAVEVPSFFGPGQGLLAVRPVTKTGKMFARIIEFGPNGARNLYAYNTKEFLWREDAEEDFFFLDQLAPGLRR